MQKAKEIPQRGLSDNPELRMYTLAECAPLLGISEITLKRYIRAHRLKAVYLAGKWRVSAANLKAFIERGDARLRKESTQPAGLESVPDAAEAVPAKGEDA